MSILLLANCTTIKSHNAHINDLISENDLKTDVDFIHKKLEKLQPKLYWYITKEKLDAKFDSLKTNINKPMTSFKFYEKLAPVIKSIGQGHLSISPYVKKYSASQKKELTKKGKGPFGQFDFEIFNDKLYITKNKSYNKTIKSGTEVVAINNEKSEDLIKKYKQLSGSDGYNTTFLNRRVSRFFSSYYTNENGIKDSILFEIKRNDSVKMVVVKRKKLDSASGNKKKKLTATEKKNLKELEKNKDLLGWNKTTELFDLNFNFQSKDSSVAIMKINGFVAGNYKKFFKTNFKSLKKSKTKTLILDLRGNTGGRISEINDLYSYLTTDSTYVFTKKSEVQSKTSLFSALNLREGSILAKTSKIILAPLYYPITFLSTKKEKDGKVYLSSKYNKKQTKKPEAFTGKMYVLINGTSFSASSIISSNLKETKRAIFVGEETGGAHNGTVAGIMPNLLLPKSKIKARLGLIAIIPEKNNGVEGRGIFPDKEIIPTLNDVIDGKDPEMEWILQDIASKK